MVFEGKTARIGICATYMPSHTFMYLRVLCYCDACLKTSALRVRVKTLHNVNWKFNTNSGTVYFLEASLDILVHNTYLVQFLITDLKQNKRNKKKSRQISSFLRH